MLITVHTHTYSNITKFVQNQKLSISVSIQNNLTKEFVSTEIVLEPKSTFFLGKFKNYFKFVCESTLKVAL